MCFYVSKELKKVFKYYIMKYYYNMLLCNILNPSLIRHLKYLIFFMNNKLNVFLFIFAKWRLIQNSNQFCITLNYL